METPTPQRGRPRQIPLDDITHDAQTQVRERLNEAVVDEYAAAMVRQEEVPAIVLFHDGSNYWLADGFHRLMAARKNGRDVLPAQVHQGTRADAVWYAAGANKSHGLQMTTADKRRAIKMALKVRPDSSNASIAKHIGVSDKTVDSVRSEMTSGSEIPNLNARTGQDGKRYSVESKPDPVDELPPDDATPEIPNEPPPVIDELPPQVEDDPEPPPILEDDADDVPPESVAQVESLFQKPAEDAVGRPITDPRVIEAFERESEIKDLEKRIWTVRNELKNRFDEHDPLFADAIPAQVLNDANNLLNAIKNLYPYAGCPCNFNKECGRCKGRGWMNKSTYTYNRTNV